MSSVKIIVGDCREALGTMPDQSVHCIVTSPPYFGLRDYGVEGQMGLEPTPAEFVEALVGVLREARRVLRDDGTLWLNLGDSYAGSWGAQGHRESTTNDQRTSRHQIENHPKRVRQTGTIRQDGLKPKDLIGIPWRVAFALQQPWYAGSIKDERDRVWLAAIIDGEGCFFIHKRKAGTSAHSKFERADGTEANYLRTQDTFGPGLEISNTNKALIERVAAIVPGGTYTEQTPDQNNRRRQTIYRWRLAPNAAKALAQELHPHLVAKQHQARLIFNCPSTGKAAADAHAAMMRLHKGEPAGVDYPAPPTLFEPGWYLRQDVIWAKSNPMPESVTDRCTKAHEYLFLLSKGPRYYYDADAIAESVAESSVARLAQDVGVQLGSDRVPGKTNGRMKAVGGAETRNRRSVWTVPTQPFKEAHFATFPPDLIEPCILAGCPIGGTILDPFGGAGTTGLVADRHQRNAILIELNPAYAEIARDRLKQDAGMFGVVV